MIHILTKENDTAVNKDGFFCVYWARGSFAMRFVVRWGKLSWKVMYIHGMI